LQLKLLTGQPLGVTARDERSLLSVEMLLLTVLIASAAQIVSGDLVPWLSSDSEFDNFVRKNPRNLVLFVGPSCAVCHGVENIFETLLAAGCNNLDWCKNGTALAKVSVDPDRFRDAKNESINYWKGAPYRFELLGYPSAVYYRYGEFERKYTGLRLWMNETRDLHRWVVKREFNPNDAEILQEGVLGPATREPELAIIADIQRKSPRQKALWKAMQRLIGYEAITIKFAPRYLKKNQDPVKDSILKLTRSWFRKEERDLEGEGQGMTIEYKGAWTADKITKWVLDHSYARIGQHYTTDTYGPWGLEEMGLDASVVAVLDDEEGHRGPKNAEDDAADAAANKKSDKSEPEDDDDFDEELDDDKKSSSDVEVETDDEEEKPKAKKK